MKLSISQFQASHGLRSGNPPSAIANVRGSARAASGFTMMEIAICLAIISFALVAILGVLPYGMNTQRDVKDETTINQDATVLLEAIRSGVQGGTQLTNAVYAITNYQTFYSYNPGSGSYTTSGGVYGYTYLNAPFTGLPVLTNNANIIGLMSLPLFTGTNGMPVNYPYGQSFYSNHVMAYVRSISGLAAEKPPQDNDIMRGDTLTYRLICENAPMPVSTNWFYYDGIWPPASSYTKGKIVLYQGSRWQASADTTASDSDIPGQSLLWVHLPDFANQLASRQRELRLTFDWPLHPNGVLGEGHQSFRTVMAGQIAPTRSVPINGKTFYFGYYFQPNSFTNSL